MNIRNSHETQAGERAAVLHKNQLTLSVASALMLGACIPLTTASAVVWRVDSNVQHTADFRTPQAANDSLSVLAGDTLLIASSTDAQVFPSLTLTKKLKIVGTGWWLKENFGSPMMGAKITTINFGTGSSGSTISSLWFGNIALLDAITDVTIYRCHFDSITDSNRWTDGWVIRNSYFGGITFNSHAQAGHVILHGNICTSYINLSSTFGSATVTRNSLWGSAVLGKSLFEGNLVNGAYQDFWNGSVVRNNLFSSLGYFRDRDGTNTIFTNYQFPVNWHSGATQYQEDPYRPTSSVTVQVMDGTTPVGTPSNWGALTTAGGYVISGIPAVPVVIGLEVPPVIHQGDPMPVTVTVKSQP